MADNPRVRLSDYTFAIVKQGNPDASAEIWISRTEEAVESVIRSIDLWKTTISYLPQHNGEHRPRITQGQKERLDAVFEKLSGHQFFWQYESNRSRLDASVLLWALLEHARTQVEAEAGGDRSSAARDRTSASGAPQQTQPGALTFADLAASSQRPLINYSDAAILEEIHARKLLSSAMQTTSIDVMQQAVSANCEAVLEAIEHRKLFDKTAEIVKGMMRAHTSATSTGKDTLASVGKWGPDNDPEPALFEVYRLLLSFIGDIDVLDRQSRIRSAAWLANSRRNVKRTCNLILQMLVRSSDPSCCGPQAALSILLHSHVPGRVMNFLSSVGLTLTKSGVRDLMARAASQHGVTTGLLHMQRQLALKQGPLQIDALMVTFDNINVVAYEANTGFLLVKDQTGKMLRVHLSDEELAALVASLRTKKCGCATGCSRRCGCFRRGIPCGKACKCWDQEQCLQPISLALSEYIESKAKRIIRKGEVIACLPAPPESDVINTSSPLEAGKPSVRVSSAVGISVGPVQIDPHEYTRDGMLQKVHITGVNRLNNCLATSTSKNAPAQIKGVNAIRKLFRNHGLLAYKHVRANERAGLVVGTRPTRPETATERVRRCFVESGLSDPGAHIQQPTDIPAEQLFNLATKLGIYFRSDSASVPYIYRKIARHIKEAEHPGTMTPHLKSLLEALDELYPEHTFSTISEVVIPQTMMHQMARAVKEAMERLHAASPALFPELPLGMKQPKDVRAWTERIVRWWEVHKMMEDELESDTSEREHAATEQGTHKQVPLQKAAGAILSTPGNFASTEQVCNSINDFWPNDEPIMDATLPDDSALNMHSCAYNVASGKHVRSQSNFYRKSNQASDRLKGDKGKNTFLAAAADAAKLRGDQEALAALAAQDTRIHDTDDESDADDEEVIDKLDTRSMDSGGWLALQDSTAFLPCRNVEFSQDRSQVSADVPDRKKRDAWKRVTVKASYYHEGKPTFGSACDFCIENPETSIDPTIYVFSGPRGPPAIVTEMESTPVHALQELDEPIDVFGERPHITIFCCDLAEKQHLEKLIAMGKLRNVTLMMAGLHFEFKTGYAAVTRAEEALELINLACAVTSLNEQRQGFMVYAFDYQREKAAQVNYALARGIMAFLVYLMIRAYIREELFTQEQADEMLDQVREGESGPLEQHLINWITREAERDNWVRAAANYVGDFATFYMVYTAARSLNVDMLEASYLEAMLLFHKTGACPKYAVDSVNYHIINMIRPEHLTDIVHRRSVSTYRGTGGLVQRGKSFEDTKSVGGMHMDEIHETMNLIVKNQNPLDENAIHREWLAQNLRHRVSAVLNPDLDPDELRHKDVFETGYERAAMVCVELIQRLDKGKLRKDIPDEDSSQRSDYEARRLVSVQIARNRYGRPHTLVTHVPPKAKPAEETLSAKALMGMAHRHHGESQIMERKLTHKGRIYKILCTPYTKFEADIRQQAEVMKAEAAQGATANVDIEMVEGNTPENILSSTLTTPRPTEQVHGAATADTQPRETGEAMLTSPPSGSGTQSQSTESSQAAISERKRLLEASPARPGQSSPPKPPTTSPKNPEAYVRRNIRGKRLDYSELARHGTRVAAASHATQAAQQATTTEPRVDEPSTQNVPQGVESTAGCQRQASEREEIEGSQ